MLCLFCNAPLTDTTMDFDDRVQEMLVTVLQAPGWVCSECGERHISGAVLAGVEALVRDGTWPEAQRRIVVSAETLDSLRHGGREGGDPCRR